MSATAATSHHSVNRPSRKTEDLAMSLHAYLAAICGVEGDHPSDYLRWTAKRVAEQPERFDWRANVQISDARDSELVIEHRNGSESYEKKMKVNAAGDVELPVPAAGTVLTSPNGQQWRLEVTDNGDL